MTWAVHDLGGFARRRRGRDRAADPLPGRSLARALGLLLALVVAVAAAADFHVTEARTRLREEVYHLDAQIEYNFSSAALEALANGVPLTIEVHIQVRPASAWVWETSLVDQRLRYLIRYKPLSERYLVVRLPGETGRTFVSREAALAALGDLRGLQLIGAGRLTPERDYEVHIRASLDIEELPLPLRPRAYLSRAWRQSSNWTKWPLTP